MSGHGRHVVASISFRYAAPVSLVCGSCGDVLAHRVNRVDHGFVWCDSTVDIDGDRHHCQGPGPSVTYLLVLEPPVVEAMLRSVEAVLA